MAAQPSSLAPEFQDEVIVVVKHLPGCDPQIGVLRRRIVYSRGGIVLATPEAEEISEAHSVAILCEAVKSAALNAILFQEEQARFIGSQKVMRA